MPRDLLADVGAALVKRQLVPTDPRKLKPGQLVRLLNSTPLGEVLNDRQLREQRAAAGLRIGDGAAIDLFRYAAWLWQRSASRIGGDGASVTPPAMVDRRQGASPAATTSAETAAAVAYEAKKERERARNAAASESGRDIGVLPAVKDPDRKARAQASFQAFCDEYFPHRFSLAWSDDHIKVLARIDDAVLRGGLFALAMPRGSGKTSLVECACLWAALFGFREFIVLIGASAQHAREMLDSLKVELETNELLAEDFPEVSIPIRRLEGLPNRSAGQLHCGERTHIGWTGDEIVLPSIAGSPASGVVVRAAGITGRIRGMKFTRADGKSVRPSLVIVDDPQTDQSARSLTQCASRERVLSGAVLGLAGPGQKIAGIMPCTVVRRGDLADVMLNREKHPEWQGERTKLVYAWPTNQKLWDDYRELRISELRNGGDGASATDFYREHRKAMDAGAVVAWPARFNHDELSAIQNAVNLHLADPASFAAEYQNEPEAEDCDLHDGLSADAIALRVNGFPRGEVPLASSHLTCFIDVQKKLLYWLVAAWRDDFTGYVVDYGAWPDQQKSYFALREAKRTLATEARGATMEGSIVAGLTTLTEELLGREWIREGESVAKIERCLIDANWGESTDAIYAFCRGSSHAAVLMPSHGKYIGAASLPMHEYKRQTGDKVGFHWLIPSTRGKRSIKHVTIDTNWWKSLVTGRLRVAHGDPGSLTLFGKKGQDHRLVSEHWTAEFPTRTQGRGRTLDEWRIKPGRDDNHWLDCLVGAAVAASMVGCSPLGAAAATTATPRKAQVKLSELQRRR